MSKSEEVGTATGIIKSTPQLGIPIKTILCVSAQLVLYTLAWFVGSYSQLKVAL
jgi:hypothetical protein